MTKIITISGKGGVGKTTLTALILDELARFGYAGRILAVDGDPATTLYLALGWPEPEATLASVRDATKLDARSIRRLPEGMLSAEYVMQQLREQFILKTHQLRNRPVDMLAMGWGEGAGCYCSINHILALVLVQIMADYDLILINSEAGLEHLSRYRIARADLFVTVTTPDRTTQAVARRIAQVAQAVKMEIGENWMIINRFRDWQPAKNIQTRMIGIPNDLSLLTRTEMLPVAVAENSPIRLALWPLLNRILDLAQIAVE